MTGNGEAQATARPPMTLGKLRREKGGSKRK
jgi:hypothetical protein